MEREGEVASKSFEGELVLRSFREDKRQRTRHYYLAERFVFEMFQEEGVVAVRGWDGAHIDGAFVCMADKKERQKTLQQPLATRLHQAITAPKSTLIGFDVKTCNLSIWKGRYGYRFNRQIKKHLAHKCLDAQFFIFVFEGVHDAIAVVPRCVSDSSCAIIYANRGDYTPLLQCYPDPLWRFMVHRRDMEELYNNIIAIAHGGSNYFCNPSTGARIPMKLHDLGISTSLSVSAQNVLGSTSFMNIQLLWKCIDMANERFKPEDKLTFVLNPFAPLVGDFLLRNELLGECIMVEHKCTKHFPVAKRVGNRAHLSLRDDHKAALGGSRVWDILIIQATACTVDEMNLWCFPRHLVEGKLESGVLMISAELAQTTHFHGANAVDSLLSFIHTMTPEIVGARQASALRLSLDDMKNTPHKVSEDPKDDTPEFGEHRYRPSGQNHELYWLYHKLIKQCRELGRMLLLPLDSGELTGDFVFLDHVWTPSEKKHFDFDKTLPFSVYSPGKMNEPCIPVMFWDLSETGASDSGSFWRHDRHCRPKVQGHEFLIVGATSNAERGIAKTCLLMPSECVRLPEIPYRESGEYWSTKQLHFETPRARKGYAHELGAVDMVSSTMHPLDLSTTLNQILPFVSRLMDSRSLSEFVIDNPQSSDSQTSIDPRRYTTTLATIANVGLEHGVVRYRFNDQNQQSP